MIYLGPLWLIAFFSDRKLTLIQGWRLAGACLLPGALGLLAALTAYASGLLDLVQLLLAFALHFVVGWIYLGLSLFALPRHPAHVALKTNPFSKPSNIS
jgi:hypothetical protein